MFLQGAFNGPLNYYYQIVGFFFPGIHPMQAHFHDIICSWEQDDSVDTATYLWTWPEQAHQWQRWRSKWHSGAGSRWSCGASGARSLWGQTCGHHGTCCRKLPGRSDGYLHHGHEGYVQQHAQCPRTQPRSGDLKHTQNEIIRACSLSLYSCIVFCFLCGFLFPHLVLQAKLKNCA